MITRKERRERPYRLMWCFVNVCLSAVVVGMIMELGR